MLVLFIHAAQASIDPSFYEQIGLILRQLFIRITTIASALAPSWPLAVVLIVGPDVSSIVMLRRIKCPILPPMTIKKVILILRGRQIHLIQLSFLRVTGGLIHWVNKFEIAHEFFLLGISDCVELNPLLLLLFCRQFVSFTR